MGDAGSRAPEWQPAAHMDTQRGARKGTQDTLQPPHRAHAARDHPDLPVSSMTGAANHAAPDQVSKRLITPATAAPNRLRPQSLQRQNTRSASRSHRLVSPPIQAPRPDLAPLAATRPPRRQP